MWDYFDLNKRAIKAWEQSFRIIQGGENKLESQVGAEESLEKLRVLAGNDPDGFKKELLKNALPLDNKEGAAFSPMPPSPLSTGRQFLLFLGVFLGVLFSALVSKYKSSPDITIYFSIGEIIISAVIAFMLIPHVYEKVSITPNTPFIVNFGLFVQNGIFWQVTINAIGKLSK